MPVWGGVCVCFFTPISVSPWATLPTLNPKFNLVYSAASEFENYQEALKYLAGFGFGASAIALFARVGHQHVRRGREQLLR